MQKACSAPAIQAKMNTLLPLASEVKLAPLLTRENGNMNAVVQQILDSGTNEDTDKKVDITTRVINLFPFTRANAQWVIHGFK